MLWLIAKHGSVGNEVVVWNGKGGAFVVLKFGSTQTKQGYIRAIRLGRRLERAPFRLSHSAINNQERERAPFLKMVQ